MLSALDEEGTRLLMLVEVLGAQAVGWIQVEPRWRNLGSHLLVRELRWHMLLDISKFGHKELQHTPVQGTMRSKAQNQRQAKRGILQAEALG